MQINEWQHRACAHIQILLQNNAGKGPGTKYAGYCSYVLSLKRRCDLFSGVWRKSYYAPAEPKCLWYVVLAIVGQRKPTHLIWKIMSSLIVDNVFGLSWTRVLK